MVGLYRAFTWVGGTVALLALASGLSVVQAYTREMPKAPQATRTVAMRGFYGKTLYVTKGERRAVYLRFGIALGGFLGCAVGELGRRRAVPRSPGTQTGC